MGLVRGGTAAVAALIVLWPGAAAANDPAAAREQVKIGYALSTEGKCDEAIPHFVESLRLEPKAVTLINLANCEEKVGRLADALGHWADARARAQSEAQRPIEEEAEKRQKALEPRVPKLTIIAPKGTIVVRDGVALGEPSIGTPLPVNPGAHVIVASAKGRAEAKTEIKIAERESKRIEVAPGEKLPDPPPPPPSASKSGGDTAEEWKPSALAWLGLSAAVVGVGVGSVTGAMALGKASTAKSDCPNHLCPDQSKLDDTVTQGRTLGTISTIAFAVGGVGALVAVYGFVIAKPKARVGVALAPNGGFIRGSF
jgi:hypothetical protein